MELPAFSPELLGTMFHNPVAFAAVIVGLVAAIRKAVPRIDGPVLVPAFAAAVGGVIGAVGHWAGLLTAAGWVAINVPFGGLLYGMLAALGGTLGLNLIELGGKLLFKPQAQEAQALALAATTGRPVQSAGAWITELVVNLVPRNKLTAALEVVAPLIREYAEASLTPDVQRELTVRINKLLRSANLVPRGVVA